MSNKISPCIWFSADKGSVKNIITYYQNVFGDYFKLISTTPLGNTPSGNAEMCQVNIFDEPYTFMSTEEKHHDLNDAVSFIITCKDQEEIDHYWNYFTKDGAESQCGWCQDTYGLRWQIIPENFGELLSWPGAWQVMMEQKKIIVGEY